MTSFEEALELHRAIYRPGSSVISDASDIDLDPDGRRATFVGSVAKALAGLASTHLCEIDLASGDVTVLTPGVDRVRAPRYSPDGRTIAFLADIASSGRPQLAFFDVESRILRRAAQIDGRAEFLDWAPDGERVLVGVAGLDADLPGSEGALPAQRTAPDGWRPTIEGAESGDQRRRIWIADVRTGEGRTVSPASLNVWEAAWCGNGDIVALASSRSDEGAWYDSELFRVSLYGAAQRLYAPAAQIGRLRGSPAGAKVAFVEGVCSDRGVVAGQLCLLDVARGDVQRFEAARADISDVRWSSNAELVAAGHRGLETVILRLDATRAHVDELWASHELTCGTIHAQISLATATGAVGLIVEGFKKAPTIATLAPNGLREVRSLNAGYEAQAGVVAEVRQVRWTADDGVEVQGWLLCPEGPAPYGVVTYLHGGPVWLWRPTCFRGAGALMLLRRGFALFLPNPRGSTGRGPGFVARLYGDPGGVDASDCHAGLDHLIAEGLADPGRLGVTGASYGGYLTCWLISQSRRFGAAAATAPFTNLVTARATSHIPRFVELLLKSSRPDSCGLYAERSPITYASDVTTPTLLIAGGLDLSTPPAEAIQFHRALSMAGAESVLITYPQEGHGIRNLPAVTDCAARLADWFAAHLCAP